MVDRLPPLAAVRVFEAAARHLSFTRAAVELGMTQAAVSYQIKLLEERVGTPLFRRLPREVQLTEAGLRLAPRTSEAFDLMRDAFSSVVGSDQGTLFISTMHTVAAQWLAPRLGSFQMAHPSLAVRLDTTSRMVDFSREEVDVGIRSGYGEWPGLVAHRILDARFTPMLSPAIVEQYGGLKEPADLLKFPLLEPGDIWWQDWFAAGGVDADALSGRTDNSLGTQALIASAAIAGHGAAILSIVFFGRELAQGALMRPFELAVDCGQNYHLVYPESRRNSPKIKAFRDWVLDQVRAG